MLSTQLTDIANSLGVLAGAVPMDTWEFLDNVRSNLRATADQVKQLESHFIPTNGEDHEQRP